VVVEDLVVVDSEAVEDSEVVVVEDSEVVVVSVEVVVVEDIVVEVVVVEDLVAGVVEEDVVVEDLLEELVLLVQLQDREGAPIHMATIDRTVDITGLGGIIIDLGIIDGGIPHIGRVVGIVLSITAPFMWVEGYYFS